MILQLIFHEGDSVECMFIFNRPKNLVILTNLMYFKSLWLKMAYVDTLHQSLVKGLNSSLSCKIASKLCNMVILKKQKCSTSVQPKRKVRTIWLDSPTFQRPQKVAFNTPTWEKKLIFHLLWICNPISLL